MKSEFPLKANNPRTVNAIDEQFLAGNTEQIPHISFEDNFFESTSGYARMTSLNISKFNFSATIRNINAQFAPVNTGLNLHQSGFNNFY